MACSSSKNSDALKNFAPMFHVTILGSGSAGNCALIESATARVLLDGGLSAKQMRERLAVGYEPARDDRPWRAGEPLQPATWLETGTADGCQATTAADLATFLRFLMADRTGMAERG